MARVFLSYDRDDAVKARTLAHALEGAGHMVWWDPHIKGGTEYGKEIEKALDEAEAVIVLWSRESVESPWVRDEASAGRDSGRMVPICLDQTKPPMGFRQYQNVDLSAWNGRAKPDRLQEVLACIDRLAVESREQPTRESISVDPSRRGLSRPIRLALIAALVFAAIAISYSLVNRAGKSPSTAVVVAAADNSPASRSLADDLFIKLGSIQSAKSDALQLVEQGSGTDADLRLRVAQRVDDGQAQATIALLAKDGGLLWSREFKQEQRPEADLRQQVAYSAASVLACATEALSPGHQKLAAMTLKLYLGGCARLAGETAEEPQPFVELFGKVTREAPDFEGGWAKLLSAETDAFNSSSRDPAIGHSLRAHINQARKLNPTMAEAYIAESWMLEIRQINLWMPLSELAVSKNPLNVAALTEHSNDMFQVGRLQQAVEFARRAVQADPLAPWVRNALITALAQAGEAEAATLALKDAERLWPGATNLIQSRFFLLARYGDPREALAMLRAGKVSRQFVSPTMESFLEARIDPSPAKVERAVQEARELSTRLFPSNRWFSQYVGTLAEFRRKEELIKVLSEYDPGHFLGPAAVFEPRFGFLHNDVRFMAIMARWGSQLDYWRKSGNWPDFCFKPELPYDCKAEAAKLAG